MDRTSEQELRLVMLGAILTSRVFATEALKGVDWIESDNPLRPLLSELADGKPGPRLKLWLERHGVRHDGESAVVESILQSLKESARLRRLRRAAVRLAANGTNADAAVMEAAARAYLKESACDGTQTRTPSPNGDKNMNRVPRAGGHGGNGA